MTKTTPATKFATLSKEGKQLSTWKHSENTAEMVRDQIIKRWGNKEGDKYDPAINCMTYKQWNAVGMQVKEGETGLESRIYIRFQKPIKDKKTGKEIAGFFKKVFVFYVKQVKPL